jgi:hypothetical protein
MSYIKQHDDYWIVKDDGGYGNALVIKTSWSSRYLALVRKYKIRIMRLNKFLGWPDSDLIAHEKHYSHTDDELERKSERRP